MIQTFDQIREWQDRVLLLSGVPPIVGISMDKWALWMRKGSAVRGYPTGSKGFVFWGVNCFDDCEEEADSIASRAVDGTMRGLEMNERAALGVLWLGHSIVFRRLDVDVLAVEGLKKIHAGLILRGVA